MRVMGRTYALRRHITEALPPGVAGAPFEAALALGYLATVLNVIANRALYALVTRGLFPGGGAILWLAFTGVSCVTILLGLLLFERFAYAALLIERVGLAALSAALLAYFWAVWTHSGGISTAVETTGATLIACIYRAITIGVALERHDRQESTQP